MFFPVCKCCILLNPGLWFRLALSCETVMYGHMFVDWILIICLCSSLVTASHISMGPVVKVKMMIWHRRPREAKTWLACHRSSIISSQGFVRTVETFSSGTARLHAEACFVTEACIVTEACVTAIHDIVTEVCIVTAGGREGRTRINSRESRRWKRCWKVRGDENA
jgi:hypothetical protein